MHIIIMPEGCCSVISCGVFRQLIALQPNPEPVGEHQREINGGEDSFDNPIDDRKDHHTRGQDEPKNHTEYTQPIGPRDKPENILQHPGDQRDQNTHRSNEFLKGFNVPSIYARKSVEVPSLHVFSSQSFS